jgi:hypothetical protein
MQQLLIQIILQLQEMVPIEGATDLTTLDTNGQSANFCLC